MKKCLSVLMLLFTVLAVQGQDFKVEGNLKSFRPVKVVVLSYNNGEELIRDSVKVQGPAFNFTGRTKLAGPASIQVLYDTIRGVAPSTETVRFFLEGGTTSVSAIDSLDNAKVTGGKGQTDYALLQSRKAKYETALQALYMEAYNRKKAGKGESTEEIEAAIEKLENLVKEEVLLGFIKEFPASPVFPFALNEYAGWDIDPAKVGPLLSTLHEDFRNHSVIVSLVERVNLARKTAIGQPALPFTQADTLGQPVSLESFRGKYVLIDFWASWCGPCRTENPNLVKAYHEFKDKNFTVLGVSLDRPNGKERWMKAIHDDKLAWTQVSDLKFWENEVAVLYGIRAIPQNVLVDPNGIIVGKNLTGKKLEAKLRELLK